MTVPAGWSETDPELAQVVGHLDAAVRAEAGLERRTVALVRLAACATAPGSTLFREIAGEALDAGDVTPLELREVAYQAVPYAGLALARDVVALVDGLLADRGVELPLEPAAAADPADDDARLARGLDVQGQVVGAEQVARMHAGAPDDEQHLQRHLTAHCFGDHVARDGLALADRELLTLAMLTALGGADGQVEAHVRGSLAVGHDRAHLLGVLTVLLPVVGYPRMLNALTALDSVTDPQEDPS